jgi:hypothetical protein
LKVRAGEPEKGYDADVAAICRNASGEIIVDNFRRRPPARPRAPEPELFPGRCYLVPQSSLVFGSDRKQEVRRRPALCWAVLGAYAQVLPFTTNARDIFFFLRREHCHSSQRRHAEERDSYVCPRAESVATAGLIEIGVLASATWEQVREWKQRWKKRKKYRRNSRL